MILFMAMTALPVVGNDFDGHEFFERVSLSSDKDLYCAGDTVFFSAHIHESEGIQRLADRSNYLYVALVDSAGKVIDLVKVKRSEDGFTGYMPLDSFLPKGIYTLAAYTMFMRNFGQENFAKIPLRVSRNNQSIYQATTAPDKYRLRCMSHFTDNWPIEAGTVLEGRVVSDKDDKPMSNVQVRAIAPSIGWGEVCTTDNAGYFEFGQLEWPDGTVFAFSVFDSKGRLVSGVHLDFDVVPEIEPIRSGYEIDGAADEDNNMSESAIMLNPVDVTAPANRQEDVKKIYNALGVRILDEDYFSAKGITDYEGAIRNLAGINVSGNRIVSTRASGFSSGTSPVEIWVDNVPLSSNSATAASKLSKRRAHSNMMHMARVLSGGKKQNAQVVEFLSSNGGGVLDEDRADNPVSLQDLNAMYPFSMVQTIEYFPPNIALSLSMSAAHAGGLLMITTRKFHKDDLSPHSGIMLVRPLGYQKVYSHN